MRHLLFASLVLAGLACAGCSSVRTDAKTMATPRKQTSLFSCSGTGPCVAQTPPGAAAR